MFILSKTFVLAVSLEGSALLPLATSSWLVNLSVLLRTQQHLGLGNTRGFASASYQHHRAVASLINPFLGYTSERILSDAFDLGRNAVERYATLCASKGYGLAGLQYG